MLSAGVLHLTKLDKRRTSVKRVLEDLSVEPRRISLTG